MKMNLIYFLSSLLFSYLAVFGTCHLHGDLSGPSYLNAASGSSVDRSDSFRSGSSSIGDIGSSSRSCSSECTDFRLLGSVEDFSSSNNDKGKKLEGSINGVKLRLAGIWGRLRRYNHLHPKQHYHLREAGRPQGMGNKPSEGSAVITSSPITTSSTTESFNTPSVGVGPLAQQQRHSELQQHLLSRIVDGFTSVFFLWLSWRVTTGAISRLIGNIGKRLQSPAGNETFVAEDDMDVAVRRGAIAPLPFSETLLLHNGTLHCGMQNKTSFLTSHEVNLMQGVLPPQRIVNKLSDLGGVELTSARLLSLVTPILLPKSSAYWKMSGAFKPPRSALLYGPPGCGKTSLVRGVCRFLDLPLLTVNPSSILNCYVGETSKYVTALFSLAQKLQPCVIFVDEMDSLFRARYAQDFPTERNVKTEFMQLWDDLERGDGRVFLMGATNRPEDLDPAILRRFSNAFELQLPNTAARIDIFKRLLSGAAAIADDFDLDVLAQRTSGYSASDITAVCRAALTKPLDAAMLDAVMGRTCNVSMLEEVDSDRVLSMSDLEEAIRTMQPSSRLATSSATSRSSYLKKNSNDNDDATSAAAASAFGSGGISSGADSGLRISIPLNEVLEGVVGSLGSFLNRVGPDLESMLKEIRSEIDRDDSVNSEELKASLNELIKWMGKPPQKDVPAATSGSTSIGSNAGWWNSSITKVDNSNSNSNSDDNNSNSTSGHGTSGDGKDSTGAAAGDSYDDEDDDTEDDEEDDIDDVDDDDDDLSDFY